MKWITNAIKGSNPRLGRFDGSAGPFRLQAIEEPGNGGFKWQVLWWADEGKVFIGCGQKQYAEDAKRAAEECVFAFCIDALKGLRA